MEEKYKILVKYLQMLLEKDDVFIRSDDIRMIIKSLEEVE